MRPLTHPRAEEISLQGILHALADPVRLELFRTLCRGRTAPASCVRCAPCDMPKSSISRHFQILREAEPDPDPNDDRQAQALTIADYACRYASGVAPRSSTWRETARSRLASRACWRRSCPRRMALPIRPQQDPTRSWSR